MENTKPQLLNLTEEERNKIYRICKHNKFEGASIKIVYPNNDIERVDYFVKCCRFFNNLKNVDLVEGISEDNTKAIERIREKIKNFFDSLKPIYEEADKLLEIYKHTESNLKLHNLSRRLRIFIDNNFEIINYTIDKTHELGKQIKQYDPDTTQGYY